MILKEHKLQVLFEAEIMKHFCIYNKSITDGNLSIIIFGNRNAGCQFALESS